MLIALMLKFTLQDRHNNTKNLLKKSLVTMSNHNMYRLQIIIIKQETKDSVTLHYLTYLKS